MHFELVQAVSLAGSAHTANDDRTGVRGGRAWVIDGATDLGEPGLLGTIGGATWLAEEADFLFRTRQAKSLSVLVTEVSQRLATLYHENKRRAEIAPWERPIAAVFIAQYAHGSLHYAWIGDCCAYLIRSKEALRLGPSSEIGASEQEAASRVGCLTAGQKVTNMEALTMLRAKRESASSRIFGTDPKAVANLRIGQCECRSGDDVILMSDGFSALIDTYRGVNETALADSLRTVGLHGLGRSLRDMESYDPHCRRWPRFKRHDDATALWLRVVDQ